ncbi:MAG TPA: DUF2530 domain-containing protein, partial [Actinopolymorphaceae bacterium]
MADTPSRSLLRTADVEPLDVDGVATLAVGTVVWAIALIALLPFRARLEAAGHAWWLWTCVAGIVVGLVGTGYCWRRRTRTRRSRSSAARSQAVPAPS